MYTNFDFSKYFTPQTRFADTIFSEDGLSGSTDFEMDEIEIDPKLPKKIQHFLEIDHMLNFMGPEKKIEMIKSWLCEDYKKTIK